MSAASLIPSTNLNEPGENEKLASIRGRKRQENITDKEIEKLQYMISDLNDQLRDERKEIISLILELQQRDRSLSWRFSQYYGKYFRMDSRLSILISTVLSRIISSQPMPSLAFDMSIIHSLKEFLAKNYAQPSVLYFSNNVFMENEEHRSVRIAQSFAERGWSVAYASDMIEEQDSSEYGEIYPNIFHLPSTFLIDRRDNFFGFRFGYPKIFIMDFPHPALFKILSYANSNDWITVYDISKDWEMINKAGQAEWYDSDVESYIILNSDLITTSSVFLSEKVKEDFKSKRPAVIPNGISFQNESIFDLERIAGNMWDDRTSSFIEESLKLDRDYSIKRR